MIRLFKDFGLVHPKFNMNVEIYRTGNTLRFDK